MNGKHALELDELEVKVKKVTTPDSISGVAGTHRAQGPQGPGRQDLKKAFVVVELTWKNKDDKTRRLNDDGKQIKFTSAAGGGAVYPVADRSEPDSFYNAPRSSRVASRPG